MEHIDCNSIAAFDTLYTTNHIQMLKILLPYLDHPQRQQITICIKYLELRHTLSCCRIPPSLSGCSGPGNTPPEHFCIQQICEQILPFCTSAEKQKLEQIRQLFHSMETYREISSMMELFRQMSDTAGQDSSSDLLQSISGIPTDPDQSFSEILMNLLSPEQRMMFEMFGGQNDDGTE